LEEIPFLEQQEKLFLLIAYNNIGSVHMSTTVTKVLRLVLLFFLIFAIVSLLKNTEGKTNSLELGLIMLKPMIF